MIRVAGVPVRVLGGRVFFHFRLYPSKEQARRKARVLRSGSMHYAVRVMPAAGGYQVWTSAPGDTVGRWQFDMRRRGK